MSLPFGIFPALLDPVFLSETDCRLKVKMSISKTIPIVRACVGVEKRRHASHAETTDYPRTS